MFLHLARVVDIHETFAGTVFCGFWFTATKHFIYSVIEVENSGFD
jgi:hypothetical protein